MNLSDVTIGITSFLRPESLINALEDIRNNFPECGLIVADDSDSNVLPFNPSQVIIRLPFDSGLSAKRNRLVETTRTKYFLLGTDDFVFDYYTRLGVQKMYNILEQNPDIDVATGSVDCNSYEGFLEYVPGSHIKETRLGISEIRNYYPIDIAANYFLARTKSIEPWEESLKIGGEHVMWFLKMKQAGKKIVWVPGGGIATQKIPPQDPRYKKMRMRCWTGHNRMKELLNIKQYIGFDGGIS